MVVRDINDPIVGRRSVLVDGAEPLLAPGEREYSEETAWADELRFSDSLRIASGLEPDWFWAETYGPNESRSRMDNAWLTEVSNVVGVHQVAGACEGRRHIVGTGGDVNHEFPEELREQDYSNEYALLMNDTAIDMGGNTWLAAELASAITVNALSELHFDFQQSVVCEIHAIALLADGSTVGSYGEVYGDFAIWKISGTQTWTETGVSNDLEPQPTLALARNVRLAPRCFKVKGADADVHND